MDGNPERIGMPPAGPANLEAIPEPPEQIGLPPAAGEAVSAPSTLEATTAANLIGMPPAAEATPAIASAESDTSAPAVITVPEFAQPLGGITPEAAPTIELAPPPASVGPAPELPPFTPAGQSEAIPNRAETVPIRQNPFEETTSAPTPEQPQQ